MDTDLQITIMVSTVDCRILSNKKLLETELNHNLRMLVVNQKVRNVNNLVIDKPFVSVINSSSKGLSKSRNIGILNISRGYVIIADDDVSYLPNFDKTVKSAITRFPHISAFTFQIQTPDGDSYKRYRTKGFIHNWISILRVSSISVVFNIERVKSENIFFDEKFGLGAKYPTGEENIFLNDMRSRGLVILSIPKPVVIHPHESSGSQITNQLIFSKGAMFRRLYGYVGILFISLFVFKKVGLPISRKGLSGLRSGLIGFNTYFKSEVF
jgi:glycosyltransferase involved in cell wall biosynthesis